MILGYDLGRRNALHNTPHGSEKSARVGEVAGFVLHRAVDSFGQASVLDDHVRSYVVYGRKVSAEPAVARAYVQALDEKDSYSRTHDFLIAQARLLIDAKVELRLTGIESNDVLAEGLLRAVNYKEGQLLLAGDDIPEQVVGFANPRFTGKGLNRVYTGSNLQADFEVLNPHAPELRPLIDQHLL
ncbi:MAG TPA: hypothetical protein VGE30_00120 [Candidatus Saccharimonadales bacterium]